MQKYSDILYFISVFFILSISMLTIGLTILHLCGVDMSLETTYEREPNQNIDLTPEAVINSHMDDAFLNAKG